MTTTPEQLRELAEDAHLAADVCRTTKSFPTGRGIFNDCAKALRDAADQLEASVKVKPLEWKPNTLGFEAETVFGKFEVLAGNYSGKWFWWDELGAAMDQPCGKSPDAEAGMQAVEDEIKRRILSAIIQGDET